MLGEASRSTLIRASRAGLGNQARQHLERGVDTDVLVVGARPARVPEERAVGGDQADIGLAVAAIDREDRCRHAAHHR